MNNKDLEHLGKSFSEMCVISENEKTFQDAIEWCIPNHEMKKQLECSRKPIQSNKFSIGTSSFCSFYILFHADIWEQVDRRDSSAFLKSLSADMIFNSKLPDSAWIKGKIHFKELNLHDTFSVSCKTFQKKIQKAMQHACSSVDSEKLIYLCESGVDFTMHCSLKIILREVKCTFDKKGITYAESRNYDCNKEIKHDFSDVSVSIGDHLFMTHKALLSQIPYFFELFDSNKSETHFELTDIDHEIFNHILTYLYYAEIPELSFKLACQLYIVAGDLKVSDLKSICSSYLGSNLNDINVLVTLKLSHEYEDTALKNECFKFIKRSNAEELTKKSIIL